MGAELSKPGDPSTPLEVICAGYSRTGTTSMHLALTRLLQGPVMHGGSHMLSEVGFNKKWVAAYRARERGDKKKTLKLLRDNTAGYAALTDTPNWDFIPELVELYPDAKVVLTTRDPAAWWTSISMNLRYALPWYLPVLVAPVPGLCWFPSIVQAWHAVVLRQMAAAKGPGAPADQDLLEIHNNLVRKSVPADRLLEMRVTDGWEPLCRFLNKPIPDEPFPKVNEAKEAEDIAKGIFARSLLTWAALLTALGLGGYAILGWTSINIT